MLLPMLLKGHLQPALSGVKVCRCQTQPLARPSSFSQRKPQQPARALYSTQHFEFFPGGFSVISHCISISPGTFSYQFLGYALLTLKNLIYSSWGQTLGQLPAQTYRRVFWIRHERNE